jgi:hypothetical protein
VNDDCEVYKVSNTKDESLDDTDFILDSGCKNSHICNDSRLLTQLSERPSATVQGISGPKVKPSCVGNLPFAGKTYCIEEAHENLISIRQLIKPGGRSTADENSLKVYDNDGNLLLIGYNKGDDFWRCSYRDLKKASQLCDRALDAKNAQSTAYELSSNMSDEVSVVNEAPDLSKFQSREEVPHFTYEERQRAQAAFDLHVSLGHPGDKSLMRSLDNGNYSTNLTGKDLRNARSIFGPCLACLEAKMHAPPQTESILKENPPENVGEQLFMDIIPLDAKSLGGHTQLLASVDRKSGHVVIVPMPSKGEKAIREASEVVISSYSQYGHKVKWIVTDDENSLKILKTHLAKEPFNIRCTATPPYLHNKRLERSVQTLKARKRTILANLALRLRTRIFAVARRGNVHNDERCCHLALAGPSARQQRQRQQRQTMEEHGRQR